MMLPESQAFTLAAGVWESNMAANDACCLAPSAANALVAWAQICQETKVPRETKKKSWFSGSSTGSYFIIV